MIRLEQISKTYPGSDQPAVRNLNLVINESEFCTFVGPSGCGKTTILRMINQLDSPDTGQVRVGGVLLSGSNIIQVRRHIGFVMQSAALFPHRTVSQNIATVPRLCGWDKARTRHRIDELVDLMSLDRRLLQRYPHELSGGQQGRVAIARALAADPPILLMDEPFAAIDPIVRDKLQGELLEIQQRLKKTIVLVTHDINEALRLGDKIAIFRQGGELVQFAPPDEILAHPASDFVRQFIGPEANLRRLERLRVADVPRYDVRLMTQRGTPITATFSQIDSDFGLVLDDDHRPVRWQSPATQDAEQVPQTIGPDDSLRYACNQLLTAPAGLLVRTDALGRYCGVLSLALLNQVLHRHGEQHTYD
ncbi:ABC transporter ATP-binding protein [Tatumella sp. JGM118]|uniref:ABC transporter ATP-binding protein n=1 Tax=Tatumella sp. JGM118 TaxID=2799796 RepID=UPI001BAF5E54|nr:ABC transporter ATP-binding protein [Tatumella sp. JGM118]MBS0908509.1 ABC transporter ATP-binding protein [Tatumella sp. JGM118]